jgi:hypothetical protein
MPSHWGMGIYSHSGGYDPIHDTYCLDCDDGDNVDRFIFGTTIPGTNIRAAVGYDWNATGPTAGQTSSGGPAMTGSPSISTTPTMTVTEYVRHPRPFRRSRDLARDAARRAHRPELRRAVLLAATELGGENVGGPLTDAVFVNRDANMYIPDVWVRLTAGKLSFEAEAVGVFGNINNIVDPPRPADDLPRARRGRPHELPHARRRPRDQPRGRLRLGDEWEDENSGTLHIDEANYLPRAAADTTISHFAFNRNYRVDLILWKELYGAVTNALYIKPRVRYNITERFFFSAASIGSFAARSVPRRPTRRCTASSSTVRSLRQRERGLLRRSLLRRALPARRARPPHRPLPQRARAGRLDGADLPDPSRPEVLAILSIF